MKYETIQFVDPSAPNRNVIVEFTTVHSNETLLEKFRNGIRNWIQTEKPPVNQNRLTIKKLLEVDCEVLRYELRLLKIYGYSITEYLIGDGLKVHIDTPILQEPIVIKE